MGDAPTAHLFSIYTSGAVRFLWLGGLAAGMYSGLTYGLKETCGTHDWVIYTQVGLCPLMNFGTIILLCKLIYEVLTSCHKACRWPIRRCFVMLRICHHILCLICEAVAGLVADGRQIVARANSEATNYGRVCGQASHLEQMPGGSEGSKDSSWRKEKLGFPKHFAIPQSKEGASGCFAACVGGCFKYISEAEINPDKLCVGRW